MKLATLNAHNVQRTADFRVSITSVLFALSEDVDNCDLISEFVTSCSVNFTTKTIALSVLADDKGVVLERINLWREARQNLHTEQVRLSLTQKGFGDGCTMHFDGAEIVEHIMGVFDYSKTASVSHDLTVSYREFSTA